MAENSLTISTQNLKRYIKPIAIVLGLFLFMFPFIFQTEIYRCLAISSDPRKSIELIDLITKGQAIDLVSTVYPAQIIFGYILGFANKLLHIPSILLFAIFDALVLLGSGFAIYYMVKKLVDKTSAILAVVIAIGGTNTILFLFRYGVVYSLLDMYVILPLAVLLLVKWLMTKKVFYLIGGLLLTALFSSLHLVSMYVPYVMGVIIVGILLYWMIKKRNMARYLVLSVIVLGVNLICYWFFLSSNAIHLSQQIVGNSNLAEQAVVSSINLSGILARAQSYILPVPILVGILALFYWFKNRKIFILRQETKILLFILGSMGVSLVGGGLLGVTAHSDRLMLDGLTLVSICVAIVIGQVWQNKYLNLYMMKMACYFIISASVFAKVIEWVRF